MMTNDTRPGDLARDRRARTPTKGIRAKLRTALRKAGIVNKFRTDEDRRDNSIVVLTYDLTLQIPDELREFEGRKVKIGYRVKIDE